MKNNKRAVAALYFIAGAVSLGYALLKGNYLVMCVGVMWLCLGVLNLRKK